MSHELRTPMNAIYGFSQLLYDEVPGKLNADQKSCFRDILNNCNKLIELIDELLWFKDNES